jgi:hypothetical protein
MTVLVTALAFTVLSVVAFEAASRNIGSKPFVLGEALELLARRKQWWLVPIGIMLALLCS